MLHPKTINQDMMSLLLETGHWSDLVLFGSAQQQDIEQ
jgi:hypothetical protein